MGRPGITYEMVAAAATVLMLEHGRVSAMAIREYLGGTGSSNTLHKHLKKWREEEQPMKAVAPAGIPDEVVRSLSSWIVQASTVARADAEDRAMSAQAEADDLVRIGEQLEAERDQLQDELVGVTTQRDQHQATAEARAAEIQRLLGEVDRERKLAGDAQIAAAEAKLRADSQVEYLAEMKARVELLTAELDRERAARVDAQQKSAVLTAQLVSAQGDANAYREHIINLQQELNVERDRVEQLHVAADQRAQQERVKLDQVRGDYEAKLDQLRAECEAKLEHERQATAQVRQQLADATVTNAQQQARLENAAPGQA